MPTGVFEPEEINLAGRVLSALQGQNTGEARESTDHIREVMDQLVRLREVVVGYPSLLKPMVVAGESRDVHTLADTICRSNPYTVEAYTPTRAVVGRAYLVGKLNFFRTLIRVVRHHLPDDERRTGLIRDLTQVLRVLITTWIAEDILVSISSDQKLQVGLRRKAVYLLIDVWEHRHTRSVRDFFPLLDSVWEAKTRITISYGTLSGTSEILGLMREGCSPEVIDYFTREHISEDERQALLELVFNASYEELETMRRWMERHHKEVVGPADVALIFNVPISRLHQTISSTQDMFFTFRERQVNAQHRAIHNLAGPKKTAEEYLMIYILEGSETDLAQTSDPGSPARPPQVR